VDIKNFRSRIKAWENENYKYNTLHRHYRDIMTKTLKLRLPKRIVMSMDELTKEGYFVSRNELIREAIREQLNSLKRRET
jgi:hypothetical protein